MKNLLKKKCVIALDIFYISSQYFFSVYVISEIIKTLQLSTIAKNPVYVAYFKIEIKWQLCKVQLQLK